MAIGFDQNAQRVSIMNLIAIDTDVTNLAVGILADMATQGQIGSAVESVPDRYREFSQVDLIANQDISLAHPVLDQHRREQVFGPTVPFRGQLCRLDTERESVTPPRRQKIDGQLDIFSLRMFEQQSGTASTQVAQTHRADLLIERDGGCNPCKLAFVLEQLQEPAQVLRMNQCCRLQSFRPSSGMP